MVYFVSSELSNKFTCVFVKTHILQFSDLIYWRFSQQNKFLGMAYIFHGQTNFFPWFLVCERINRWADDRWQKDRDANINMFFLAQKSHRGPCQMNRIKMWWAKLLFRDRFQMWLCMNRWYLLCGLFNPSWIACSTTVCPQLENQFSVPIDSGHACIPLPS